MTYHTLQPHNSPSTSMWKVVATSALLFGVGVVVGLLASSAGDGASDSSSRLSSVFLPVEAEKTSFSKLVFEDNFDNLNVRTWQHEITMGGGGNWEFEMYNNNRSNSFVKDGSLFIKPTLTSDLVGLDGLNSADMDLWGSSPADMCTGNKWFGCMRTGGAGGNILNPISSARVRTVNSFKFTYGKVEIRAKMPKGDWLWPAIWMLPADNAYGSWPASGEIDLVESRGNDPSRYPDGGSDQIGTTLHWGPHWPLDPYEKTHGTYNLPSGQTFTDDFHVFGLLWNETHIVSYVDSEDNVVLNHQMDQSFWEFGGWNGTNYDNPWAGRGNSAPFDQDFYIVFNVAVGGVSGYFPDGVGGKPWTNADSHAVNAFWSAKDQWYPTWGEGDDRAMQVDYVKVWQ